jgi:cell division protein ZapA
MNDKIKINLMIADSYYPITIEREKEELMRKAAKQVNIRLNAYRDKYKTLPPEKLLAMVAYHFAQDNILLQERNDTEPYSTKIKELTELLEKHFRGE